MMRMTVARNKSRDRLVGGALARRPHHHRRHPVLGLGLGHLHI
jgi:hypothetical protein